MLDKTKVDAIYDVLLIILLLAFVANLIRGAI